MEIFCVILGWLLAQATTYINDVKKSQKRKSAMLKMLFNEFNDGVLQTKDMLMKSFQTKQNFITNGTILMQSYFQLTLILISSSITFQQPTKPEIACRTHHHIGSSHYGSFLYSN